MLDDRTRMHFRLLAWTLSGALSAALAHAQATNAELLATYGGRIIGNAKACRINAERIRRTTEKVLLLVKSKALSAAEQDSVTDLFAAAQKSGADEVRAQKVRCQDVHVEFSEVEIKLVKHPGGESTAAHRSRPVQPLGALKPDSAQAID